MAKCVNYKTGEHCPLFYKCNRNDEYLIPTSSENVIVVTKSTPGQKPHNSSDDTGGKKLEQYCVYCMATKRGKKIGRVATWAGGTPKWCPLGRDEG